VKLEFTGNASRELVDKRTDELVDHNAFVFRVYYADDTTIEILASSAFPSREQAAHYANMLLRPVGQLPPEMRQRLSHIVVLQGNETAFAEHEGHFFVVYSENMDFRSSNHDLEETVFHESVHATLDEIYLESEEWLNAQRLDDIFITKYAQRNPYKEDMAESALFVYTYLMNPDRLPPYVANWVEKMMPNRVEFFKKMFEGSK